MLDSFLAKGTVESASDMAARKHTMENLEREYDSLQRANEKIMSHYQKTY